MILAGASTNPLAIQECLPSMNLRSLHITPARAAKLLALVGFAWINHARAQDEGGSITVPGWTYPSVVPSPTSGETLPLPTTAHAGFFGGEVSVGDGMYYLSSPTTSASASDSLDGVDPDNLSDAAGFSNLSLSSDPSISVDATASSASASVETDTTSSSGSDNASSPEVAFGYYAYLSDPRYIYHVDLGYEFVIAADDQASGVYLYDFTSQGFFYTSWAFPFPYLYDFRLDSVVYYYPDPNNPGRYNTDGVRYFYVFNTGRIISK